MKADEFVWENRDFVCLSEHKNTTLIQKGS